MTQHTQLQCHSLGGAFELHARVSDLEQKSSRILLACIPGAQDVLIQQLEEGVVKGILASHLQDLRMR